MTTPLREIKNNAKRFEQRDSVIFPGAWCHYCGSDQELTVDHIVPRAAIAMLFIKGTSRYHEWRDKKWNAVAACLTCNAKKGAEWPTCGCHKCQFAIMTFLERCYEAALAENAWRVARGPMPAVGLARMTVAQIKAGSFRVLDGQTGKTLAYSTNKRFLETFEAEIAAKDADTQKSKNSGAEIWPDRYLHTKTGLSHD